MRWVLRTIKTWVWRLESRFVFAHRVQQGDIAYLFRHDGGT